MKSSVDLLMRAWSLREKLFTKTTALRVFHGPGEGKGDWCSISVDRLADHYWITQWSPPSSPSIQKSLIDFYQMQGGHAFLGVDRPAGQPAGWCRWLGGAQAPETWWVQEGGCHFQLSAHKTRHYGLYLDHFPLREWIVNRVYGWKVLNLFAYTGSLSVAAVKGQASEVVSVDLSPRMERWAQHNFQGNGLRFKDHRWYVEDVFYCCLRLIRLKEIFDLVIVDPPPFSQGPSGAFSIQKDLVKLHLLALKLLKPGGYLVTSLNAVSLSYQKYLTFLIKAAKDLKQDLQVIQPLHLPETFPTRLAEESSRYLKGWILRSFS